MFVYGKVFVNIRSKVPKSRHKYLFHFVQCNWRFVYETSWTVRLLCLYRLLQYGIH